jgi:putative acyl-CoA dehydrogenase
MHKDPATVEALQQEIASATGVNSIFDRFAGALTSAKQMRADAEFSARWFVEKMALALQAAVSIRSGNQRIADAFRAARLSDSLGVVFGTLRSNDCVALLLERAQPKVQPGVGNIHKGIGQQWSSRAAM